MVEKQRKIVAVEGDHKLAIVLSANKWVYTVVLWKDFECSHNYLDYALESVFLKTILRVIEGNR